jgi:F-type H+-transporting ATPase subunit b
MSEWFSNVIQDPNFWVMISTILCFGFIGFKAWAPIQSGLDARAGTIEKRLAEAEALRNEAQNILQEYKQRSENALHEAEEVLKNAQRRADHLREQMEKELKETIARHEITAKNRIARMEEEAISSIKNKIITSTLNQVKTQAANQDLVAPSIDQSLDDIKKTLQK